MKQFFRVFVLVSGVLGMGLGLAACESDVRVQKLPALTFSHLGEVKINVSRLETASKYKAPLKRPNVEHLFTAQPTTALKTWATDRLKPAGRAGMARFTVHEASVIEEKLKMDSSFTGVFTKQQSERYTARVEATLEVFDARGKRLGFASANAVRSKTIREDATLNEREKIWFNLVEELVTAFDKEMTKNMKRHLVNWMM
jgi:hypothetical protein